MYVVCHKDHVKVEDLGSGMIKFHFDGFEEVKIGKAHRVVARGDEISKMKGSAGRVAEALKKPAFVVPANHKTGKQLAAFYEVCTSTVYNISREYNVPFVRELPKTPTYYDAAQFAAAWALHQEKKKKQLAEMAKARAAMSREAWQVYRQQKVQG